MPSRFFKTTVFYVTIFLQGLCQIALPAASVILQSSRYNSLSGQQYGLTFLPLIVMTILATAVFPYWLHRLGERKIFFIGVVCDFCFLSLVLLAGKLTSPEPSFMVLLAANVFLGAGFGFLVSVLNVLLVELYPEHCDASLAGLHGFLGIGCSVSPLLVEFFYQSFHWSGIVFLIASGLVVSSGVASVVAVFEPAGGIRRERKDELFGVPKSWPRMIVLILVTLAIYGMAESLLGNWSPVFLVSEKYLPAHSGAVCLALFWGSVTAGRLLTSVLMIRFDSRLFYRLAPVILFAGLLLILSIRTAQDVYAAFILAGLGCSCIYPISVSLGIQAHPGWRDALSGFGIGALMAGVFIGSTVTGFLRESGLIHLYQAFIVAAVCAVMMFLLARLISTQKHL
jgi:MFS family permease